jgi:uncharacterized protein YmfQ (DUF2313 family)
MGVRTPLLAEATKRMFEVLPPYYEGDDTMEAILDALGVEIERIDDFLEGFRFKTFPQNADDEFRTLGIWESRLGLPVEPAGQTIEQRRDLVLARLRGRNASSGADWVEALSTAMGGTALNYEEGPAAYTITIYLPFSSGSYNSVLVQSLARAITPAHLEIAVVFNQGFIVGEGRVGEDRL